MMRYCGFFLGMGIGLFSSMHQTAARTKFTTTMKVTAAVLAVGSGKLSEFIPLPKSNLYLTYASAFTMSMALPVVFCAVVPYVVAKLCGTSKKRKSN